MFNNAVRRETLFFEHLKINTSRQYSICTLLYALHEWTRKIRCLEKNLCESEIFTKVHMWVFLDRESLLILWSDFINAGISRVPNSTLVNYWEYQMTLKENNHVALRHNELFESPIWLK